jgi:hypothetical protein
VTGVPTQYLVADLDDALEALGKLREQIVGYGIRDHGDLLETAGEIEVLLQGVKRGLQ